MITKLNSYINNLSNNKEINDEINDKFEKTEDIEIIQITGILTEDEINKLDENIIIHAGDFSNTEIKKGQYIYLSCLMKKPGTTYSVGNQGVIQCRVTEIWSGLTKLNSLMK